MLTPAYGIESDPCPDRKPQDLNERFSTLLEAACRKLDAHPLEHRGHLTLAFLRAGKLPVQLYDAGACGLEVIVRSQERIGRRRGFVFRGVGLLGHLRRARKRLVRLEGETRPRGGRVDRRLPSRNEPSEPLHEFLVWFVVLHE